MGERGLRSPTIVVGAFAVLAALFPARAIRVVSMVGDGVAISGPPTCLIGLVLKGELKTLAAKRAKMSC